MAWTTPKNWNVGELLIASDFNTHFRDNLNYLYGNTFGLWTGTRTTLSGAAATLGISGLADTWQVLRGIAVLRGTNAATSDSVRLRLGDGAGLDTTTTNYYTYNDGDSGTGPTANAQENLGATAGIFTSVFIPGNNATANYFCFLEFTIINGDTATSGVYKEGHFVNSYQLANTTGNLANERGYGKWINTSKKLTQISFITNSGSNLAAGSWCSVYQGAA